MLHKSLRLIFAGISDKIVFMNFKESNDKEREYYNRDFSNVAVLLNRIRETLINGGNLNISDLNLTDIFEFKANDTIVYVSLFDIGKKFIRYGSRRSTLEQTLNRCIEMLKKNTQFSEFDLNDETFCRIMVEVAYDKISSDFKKLNTSKFDEYRFEPGITGIEIAHNGISYYYMPTDAVTFSQMSLKSALNTVIRKTPIAKITNKISERIKILFASKDYDCYLFKSRAFVSFKDKCIPLYRGNVRYTKFDRETLLYQILKSSEWLIDNMYDDGRFLYYYDCTDDNFKDHEHPNRTDDNLYYNDLRHCGGIITLLRAYVLSGEDKFIISAKKALDWSISICAPHNCEFGKAYFAYYNNKGKLGGSGVLLVALMQYRNLTGDKSYDEYIKGLTRHILSRVSDNGEMLGYYIHPEFQNGQPLIKMNENERKATFSFYYPGEALLGLALFANNFKDDEQLINTVRQISEKALDWIIDVRPEIYADLFTALPSDAWLMQAVEEWAKDENFRKENYLNFVFNDARTMIDKMYQRDDSPYIDYEGGYYYEYGDHYYPDGARSEGLIASYYLAKMLDKKELAQKILDACKNAAMCQFHLFNTEASVFAHKNPQRSLNSFRFKSTRQWVRVDSIQHVACFFARLYSAEK